MRHAVGTLSRERRHVTAVTRSTAFVRHVVITDKPVTALGVRKTTVVLDLIRKVADCRLPVILISTTFPSRSTSPSGCTTSASGRRVVVLRPERRSTAPTRVAIMTRDPGHLSS